VRLQYGSRGGEQHPPRLRGIRRGSVLLNVARMLWSATGGRAEPKGETFFRQRGLCRIVQANFGESLF
jgi:hypothetical protein